MVYAVMLDNYQSRVGPDEYCISFAGTLSECQAVTTIPDKQRTWEKRSYSDCHRVGDHPLEGEPGGIYELIPVANFAGKTSIGRVLDTVQLPMANNSSELIPLVAISIGVGFAIGMSVGLLLHGEENPGGTRKGDAR